MTGHVWCDVDARIRKYREIVDARIRNVYQKMYVGAGMPLHTYFHYVLTCSPYIDLKSFIFCSWCAQSKACLYDGTQSRNVSFDLG
jgi:hypothetical protein